MTKKGKTMKRKPQAFELTDDAGEIGYRWPNPKADSCEIRRDIIDHLVAQVNEARQVATRAMAVLMAEQVAAAERATWGPPTGPPADWRGWRRASPRLWEPPTGQAKDTPRARAYRRGHLG